MGTASQVAEPEVVHEHPDDEPEDFQSVAGLLLTRLITWAGERFGPAYAPTMEKFDLLDDDGLWPLAVAGLAP